MRQNENYYEKKAIKHLKRIDFSIVEKLDSKYKGIKAPDYLLSKQGKYFIICEIKSIKKFPKKESNFQLDSAKIVSDLFCDVVSKYKSLLDREPKYNKYPYILIVFDLNDFYWDRFGFLNKDIYSKYPEISAVLNFKAKYRKEEVIKELNAEEIKALIKNNDTRLVDDKNYIPEVFCNKFAKIKIKKKEFPQSIMLSNYELNSSCTEGK